MLADAGVVIPIGRLQVRIVIGPGVDHVTLGRNGSLVLGD